MKNINLKIPKGSEKYILFQRTKYLLLASNRNIVFRLIYKFITKVCSYNCYVKMEAFLFSRMIHAKFTEDINEEYLTIKDYLPTHAKNVLDIGCGVAGIDALIYEHYDNDFEVYLLDKTFVDKKVFYKLERIGSFYNSLSIAQDLLVLNNVPESQIHTQEVDSGNQIAFDTQFDIVISQISWGFHYPISVYLDQVYEKMRTSGVLIVDVRKNSGGEDLLRKKFGFIKVIYEDKSFNRVLVIKN